MPRGFNSQYRVQGSVAQRTERQVSTLGGAGSNPAGATTREKVKEMTATLTGTVEVLNGSYASLGPTSIKRAIALVARGDAVISEFDPNRAPLTSAEGLGFPWPLVIRLLKTINVPFYVGPAHYSKAGVRKRDGGKCAYCGGPGETVDHIFPQARGGADEWMNTITACTRCNGKKGNRTPEEANMPLMFTPSIPQRVYLTGGKRHKRK